MDTPARDRMGIACEKLGVSCPRRSGVRRRRADYRFFLFVRRAQPRGQIPPATFKKRHRAQPGDAHDDRGVPRRRSDELGRRLSGDRRARGSLLVFLDQIVDGVGWQHAQRNVSFGWRAKFARLFLTSQLRPTHGHSNPRYRRHLR